ncbi:MAG: hypothetical protein AAF567_14805 [Actinomycetota bacterium]
MKHLQSSSSRLVFALLGVVLVALLGTACGADDPQVQLAPTAPPPTATAAAPAPVDQAADATADVTRDWCTVVLDLEAQSDALDPFQLGEIEFARQSAMLTESFFDELIRAAPADLPVDVQAMADRTRTFNRALADAGWDFAAVDEPALDAFFAGLDDGIAFDEYNAANCGTLAGTDSFESDPSAPAATVEPAPTAATGTDSGATDLDAQSDTFSPAEIEALLADPAERDLLLAPFIADGLSETEAECVVRAVLQLPLDASDAEFNAAYTGCGL